MLALTEAVPYIAFAGAGLLVAFVAGEALYRKFLSLRLGAFSAKPIAASRPVVKQKPEPQVIIQNESSDRVEVLDQGLNVRIEDSQVATPKPSDSDRQGASGQEFANKKLGSDDLQPIVERIVTVEVPVLVESGRQQAVLSEHGDARLSARDADTLEVGNLCNEDVAIRRDASVRVFDAVVAPSERKSSAA